MEEVVNNQQLDQQPADTASPTEGNRDRQRLVYGIVAVLLVLVLLGLAIAYYFYFRPAPPKVSKEAQRTPSTIVERKEEEQPAAPVTVEESLERELDDLEKDLETLDQIDSELNSPEVDLDLGL